MGTGSKDLVAGIWFTGSHANAQPAARATGSTASASELETASNHSLEGGSKAKNEAGEKGNSILEVYSFEQLIG